MNKKIALILAPLMAAILIGAGYAMWSDTLYMDVTIKTGTVDVRWSLDTWGDDEPEGKDASSISAYRTTDMDGDLVDRLVVTINNAYPCITYWLKFDIHCFGSVPVHIYPVVDYHENNFIDDALTITYTDDKGEEIPCEDIWGYQLHNCDRIWAYAELHFDNDMGFEQGTTYTFDITVNALQYNEAD